MDVLGGGVDGKSAGLQRLQNLPQTGDDGFRVSGGENALGCQHGGVGHGATDILGVHPAVKADGGIEVIGLFVQRLAETAGPHFIHR